MIFIGKLNDNVKLWERDGFWPSLLIIIIYYFCIKENIYNFPYFFFSSTLSKITIAVAASNTGTTLGTIIGSCLP